jgi:hypothetical protein
MKTIKTATIFMALTLLSVALLVNMANAQLTSFESPTGYDLYAEYCATLERSTELAYSPTHSIKFHLPQDTGPGTDCETPYARVTFDHTSPLKDTFGTFKAYIASPGGESANLAPYMMFRVDSNQNGVYDFTGYDTGDSIVIAFITGGTPYPTGTWFDTGLDPSTKVHVVGNRSGLAPGTYSSSGTQDTLGNLCNMTFSGSTKWGDLNVIQGAVAAGLWPNNPDYIAYVDDINLSVSKDYNDVTLSGGYQAQNFPEVWDITACGLRLSFTVDLTGMVDKFGGNVAHAWSELGIRDTTGGNFNPNGKGVWLATDYDWTINTFNPDPPGAPILDMDDKLILQKQSGQGEGAYNLPSVPPAPGNNYRFWFDRDGVDQWQALSPLAVDGGTYNTNGIYRVVINLSATSGTAGNAYMSINELNQGFETDGNWNTMELSPAGMTFTGDMKHMQVFYGLYGYGATHTAVFRDINVTGCNNPPVAKCKDVTISADLGCTATVSIDSINNGSYDPDGDPITLTLDHSGPYGKGNTNVTLTVTDSKGATDTCPATVTVEDTTQPVITTCPEPMVIIAGANGKAAVPDLVAKTVASDTCDLHPVITQTPAAGTLVGVGVTVVTITATDTGGNISDPCTVEVTVLGPNGVKAGILTDLRSLLQSGKVTYSGDRTKLQDAINHMTKSLEVDRWLDASHPKPGSKGESVFNEEKAAVIKLKELRDGNKSGIAPAVFQGFIDRIVANDRLLAEIAISDAIVRHGNAGKIKTAKDELTKGDVEAGKDHPDKAIDHYKNAWKNAIAA